MGVIVIGGLVFVSCIAVKFLSLWPFEDNSQNLSLDAIPGISSYALAKKNVTFRVQEPVAYYRGENLAVFDVDILVPGLAEPHLTFTGDAERFNGFAAELDFLKENSGRFRIGAAGGAAIDGITSLVSGLWGLVRHPIDSGKAISSASVAFAKYSAGIVKGKVDAATDIKNLASAAYVNAVSEIATEAHFSYQEAVTDEARATARAIANWKLSGRGLTEVALILVPFSEIKFAGSGAKLGEIAKGASLLEKTGEGAEAVKGYETLLKSGSLFSQGERILNSLRRIARFNSAESKLAEQIIRPLCDPVKLASLGMRAANPRVHKLLYHLYDLERNGGNVARALDRALVPGVKGEFYYSQQLSRNQILNNFKTAKEMGVFDDASNIEKMRRGMAPTITRGPNVGKVVHVDHIIPLKHAPELGNNMANLRYLANSENLARNANLDLDAAKLISEMKSAGWNSSSDLLTAAKTIKYLP